MHRGLSSLLWLATLLLSAGCVCENSEISSLSNVTGEFRAVLFERSCGATTSFSTQVSVLRAGRSLPNEAGNVFVSDDDSGAAQAAEWGGPYASIDWAGERTLVIAFDRNAEVYKSVEELAGVTVMYRPVSR